MDTITFIFGQQFAIKEDLCVRFLMMLLDCYFHIFPEALSFIIQVLLLASNVFIFFGVVGHC